LTFDRTSVAWCFLYVLFSRSRKDRVRADATKSGLEANAVETGISPPPALGT
jgi:hypothetical protein